MAGRGAQDIVFSIEFMQNRGNIGAILVFDTRRFPDLFTGYFIKGNKGSLRTGW